MFCAPQSQAVMVITKNSRHYHPSNDRNSICSTILVSLVTAQIYGLPCAMERQKFQLITQRFSEYVDHLQTKPLAVKEILGIWCSRLLAGYNHTLWILEREFLALKFPWKNLSQEVVTYEDKMVGLTTYTWAVQPRLQTPSNNQESSKTSLVGVLHFSSPSRDIMTVFLGDKKQKCDSVPPLLHKYLNSDCAANLGPKFHFTRGFLKTTQQLEFEQYSIVSFVFFSSQKIES